MLHLLECLHVPPSCSICDGLAWRQRHLAEASRNGGAGPYAVEEGYGQRRRPSRWHQAGPNLGRRAPTLARWTSVGLAPASPLCPGCKSTVLGCSSNPWSGIVVVFAFTVCAEVSL
jgi:hypothetical protein